MADLPRLPSFADLETPEPLRSLLADRYLSGLHRISAYGELQTFLNQWARVGGRSSECVQFFLQWCPLIEQYNCAWERCYFGDDG